MPVIPQRELRNQVSAILRRAEQGERFTITVDGRPVAELGPLATTRQPATSAQLKRVFDEAPVDPQWRTELQRLREEDARAADHDWRG